MILRTIAEEIIARHNNESNELGKRFYNFSDCETWMDAASEASIRMAMLEQMVCNGGHDKVDKTLLDIAKWCMVAADKYRRSHASNHSQ